MGVDPNNPFGEVPPELQAIVEQAKRKQQLAQTLQQRIIASGMPQQSGPVASRMSPFTPLLQALGAYVTGKTQDAASQQIAQAGSQYQKGMMDERAGLQGVPPEEAIAKLLASQYGPNRQYGESLSKERVQGAQVRHFDAQNQHMANQDVQEALRTNIQRGQLDETTAHRLQEKDYRDRYLTHLDAQLAEASRHNQQDEIARLIGLKNQAAQIGIAGAHLGLDRDKFLFDKEKFGKELEIKQQLANQKDPALMPKPIPPASLKVINDEKEALGVNKNLESDLGQIVGKLEKDEIKLGPLTNLVSKAQNALGASTPQSRNFGEAKATIERMRNDSLRLNKGTQTEGDAVRAFQEIFDHMNDKEYVLQRLKAIRTYNARAAAERMQRINAIRTNFNHPDEDFTQYLETASTPSLPPGGGGTPTLADIQAERARRAGGK